MCNYYSTSRWQCNWFPLPNARLTKKGRVQTINVMGVINHPANILNVRILLVLLSKCWCYYIQASPHCNFILYLCMETQKILGTLLKYWCGIEKTVHVFKRDRFHVLLRNLRKGKTCKVSSGAKNVNRFSPPKFQSLRQAVACKCVS